MSAKRECRLGERACLRPKAEFARSSVRGLRRVQNFVQDAKGTCKKIDKVRKTTHIKPGRPCFFNSKIRSFVLGLFLAALFVFAGIRELQAADKTSGEFIFEYCNSNAAWGRTLNGFFIDSEGDVWKYDHSADSWQPSRSDGIYYDFDQKAKYKDAKKMGVVDKKILSAMASLIESASQGELKKHQGGNDMGALSYIAYLYDPSADTYKEVVLSSKGDFVVENTSSAAKTLTQWLESVFFQQQSQPDNGGSQQSTPRGRIRAVNPELKVIQKIPAPKQEITVEQKGPFPVEDRDKQP